MSDFPDDLIMDVKIFTSYLQIRNWESSVTKIKSFTLEEAEETQYLLITSVPKASTSKHGHFISLKTISVTVFSLISL